MKNIRLLFLLVLCLSSNIHANAQTADNHNEKDGLKRPQLNENDLTSRIDNIEQNIVALQKQVYAEKHSNLGSVNGASIAAQFDELYQNLKEIRGEIEQIQFDYSKLNDKFNKFSSDIEMRITELTQLNNQKINAKNADNKKLNNIDTQINQQTLFMGSDQKALQKNSKDQKISQGSSKAQVADAMFKKAYTLMKEKKLSNALKQFQDFIDKNPNNTKISEAYFWIGEIYYQKSKYKESALNYLKGYQKNPKGTKAPDNLLKLSEALAKLYKTKEACLTLVKLKKEFPKADSAIKKRMKELGTNLACK